MRSMTRVSDTIMNAPLHRIKGAESSGQDRACNAVRGLYLSFWVVQFCFESDPFL